jgi:hypothetical protein
MELKNVNPNGENVAANNLITMNFFLENCENEQKNEGYL